MVRTNNMYRVPKITGSTYSTEDSSETNASYNNGTSDSDARQLLESLSQGQKSPYSCASSHPLFSHERENVPRPCQPKRIAYMELFDGNRFQLLGEEWQDFSICDFFQGETKDLRSLMKTNQILERKALQIPPLKEELNKLQSQVRGLRVGMKDMTHHAVTEVLRGYTSKGITKWSIEKMVDALIKKMDEDGVQMPDYALKSAGASIVKSRTTRSYRHDGGKYFWMSFIMLPFVKSPDVILQPNYHPGNCWSFPGDQGETVIKLAKKIIPRSVTIEHISKKVSPTGEISSAPKDFAVYGLGDEKEEEGMFLGQFLYDTEGDLIQTFLLKNETSELISHVKLKVISNWGHPNYTCVYRFRVHGDPENI